MHPRKIAIATRNAEVATNQVSKSSQATIRTDKGRTIKTTLTGTARTTITTSLLRGIITTTITGTTITTTAESQEFNYG